MTLTASNIKYLLSLNALDNGRQGVRCVDISNDLGVAKSSVHKMINLLSSYGIVNKTHYGNVYLTDSGKRLAKEYKECADLFIVFFENRLCFAYDDAKDFTYFVLAKVDIEQICKTRERLKPFVSIL